MSCVEPARWKATWLDGPVVCVALDRISEVAPDFESFLRVCEEGLKRPGRFSVVIDLSGSKASATRRQRLTQWAGERRPEIAAHVVAIAVVARGPLERGVLTAITWVTRPQVPVRAFATRAEATGWAQETVKAQLASSRVAHTR